MRKALLLSFFLVSISGCSSYFTRKGCEKVNWFQHAHDVAMQGKRLQEDGRLRECRQAETEISDAELDKGFKMGMENYCKLETAMAKGASGESFNYDFCDPSIAARLKAQHTEGVRKFCTPEMAYSFGSTGGIYKNQCNKSQEAAYMPRYRKGRQVYLKNQIIKNEGELTSLDREIREQQNQRTQLNSRLARLPKRTVMTKDRKFDPATNSYKETTSMTEDPNIKQQREDLERDLRSINNQIQDKLDKQRTIREENSKLKSEIEGLG